MIKMAFAGSSREISKEIQVNYDVNNLQINLLSKIIRLDEIEYTESYNLYDKLQKITKENLPAVTIGKTLLEFIISSRNSDRYYKTFHDILFAETCPSILDFRRLRD